jgi:E3 ubiquitin-protein ligase MYCBP2
MKPAFKDVCRKQECINLMQSTCEKVLPCGHPCCGFSGEKKCMPCLDPKCIDKMDPSKKINQNIDDYCTVCQCSGLGQEPCVHLDCGHIFHLGCVKT